MTSEEAIKELEWVKERGYVADKGIIGSDRIEDAVLMAIVAMEVRNRYRWHNIRKNPDDVPDTERDVFVAYEWIGKVSGTKYSEYGVGYYEPDKHRWSEFEMSVIAWRDIEPIEEEAK